MILQEMPLCCECCHLLTIRKQKFRLKSIPLTFYVKSVVEFGRCLQCPTHLLLLGFIMAVLRSAITRLRGAQSKHKQKLRNGLLHTYEDELDSDVYDHARYVLRMLPLSRMPLPQSAWRLLMAFGERDPAFCNFIIPHFATSGRVLMCVSTQ